MCNIGVSSSLLSAQTRAAAATTAALAAVDNVVLGMLALVSAGAGAARSPKTTSVLSSCKRPTLVPKKLLVSALFLLS